MNEENPQMIQGRSDYPTPCHEVCHLLKTESTLVQWYPGSRQREHQKPRDQVNFRQTQTQSVQISHVIH